MEALSDDLVAFLDGGLAVIVATRDEELQPEIARGWGLHVHGAELALCVSVASGSRTRKNLERNGAIAVTCSRPTTYRTVQLKGTVAGVSDPDDDDRARVSRHLDAFVDEVTQVGLRAEVARGFLEPELVAVRFRVRELYDQTPGKHAGERL